ncbi:hypothetical protein E2562_014439 [Oryza meyeriana var. granulata]|uniref:Uncharacterized protein n=1 Tax=Oryza meyeriana var. granulata TaxID=110450 RepID=A0A6G1CNZ8_9ORYZ|nr:hypothetical protein E2562_014439 [Oryza meyeriana var. granulata]
MTVEDAEWFRRLTGRREVAISSRDYKFYSPRHKYRRITRPASAEGDSSPLVLHMYQIISSNTSPIYLKYLVCKLDIVILEGA